MRKILFILGLAILATGFADRASADQETDRAAAQQIARNMKISGELKDYRVGVKFQDGVAWLQGTVTSRQQREMAERIARSTEGVEKVICKIDVVAPEAPAPTETSREVVQTAAIRPAAPSANARPQAAGRSNMPMPYAPSGFGGVQPAEYGQYAGPAGMGPQPMPGGHIGGGGRPVNYESPQMPGYAWPSYASHPNYAALTYPQQYSASAWPYIGPFYPYPQVPLGWRKVTLEWDDGWWFLDFNDCKDCH